MDTVSIYHTPCSHQVIYTQLICIICLFPRVSHPSRYYETLKTRTRKRLKNKEEDSKRRINP